MENGNGCLLSMSFLTINTYLKPSEKTTKEPVYLQKLSKEPVYLQKLYQRNLYIFRNCIGGSCISTFNEHDRKQVDVTLIIMIRQTTLKPTGILNQLDEGYLASLELISTDTHHFWTMLN